MPLSGNSLGRDYERSGSGPRAAQGEKLFQLSLCNDDGKIIRNQDLKWPKGQETHWQEDEEVDT